MAELLGSQLTGCWARKDHAPAFEAIIQRDRRGEPVVWVEAAYNYACGEPAADDLGLCYHHRRQILGLRARWLGMAADA
jgi:hypothetical protein